MRLPWLQTRRDTPASHRFVLARDNSTGALRIGRRHRVTDVIAKAKQPAVAQPARPTRSARGRKVIRGYLHLPHTVPVIAVLASTAAFAVVAADKMPPIGTLTTMLLATLGGQVVVGVVNELVDAETDARVKPTKPIPAGEVSIRGARLLSLLGLLAMFIFGARLGWTSLLICLFGNGVGIAYSLWFKRTIFAWLPYFVALPLVPIWAFVTVAEFDARLLMLYPLGSLAAVAIHLAQSLPDVAADRAAGIRNLTNEFGETWSFLLAVALVGMSALVAGAAASLWNEEPGFVVSAAMLVAAMVVGNALLFRWKRRIGVMACFPCIAASSGILGIAWVVAITR
jgi:4-hydroxybenzoate polyprenyltransferase